MEGKKIRESEKIALHKFDCKFTFHAIHELSKQNKYI